MDSAITVYRWEWVAVWLLLGFINITGLIDWASKGDWGWAFFSLIGVIACVLNAARRGFD